jgi:hypothetical protein
MRGWLMRLRRSLGLAEPVDGFALRDGPFSSRLQRSGSRHHSMNYPAMAIDWLRKSFQHWKNPAPIETPSRARHRG